MKTGDLPGARVRVPLWIGTLLLTAAFAPRGAIAMCPDPIVFGQSTFDCTTETVEDESVYYVYSLGRNTSESVVGSVWPLGCSEGAMLVAAFSDEDDAGGVGYFALAASPFTRCIELEEIPLPMFFDARVVSAAETQVEIMGPRVADLEAGFYTDGFRSASEVLEGYRIYVQKLARDSAPPKDRKRDAWTAATGILGLGTSIGLSLKCSVDEDVYFATSLVFDNGVETAHLSSNSRRIRCGPLSCDDPNADADADGHSFVGGCGTPRDCKDGNPAVYPGAPQVCDDRNNDCSDPRWPELPPEERDGDGDGFTVCGGDCDDTNSTTHPGAPQLCDGVNNDCSEGGWPEVPSDESDDDRDGYSDCEGDCDDASGVTFPGAPQICDGLNNDCTDASWPALIGTNEADSDGDSFSACEGDCNDTRENVYPGAPDVCDGLDNDCDGEVDDDGICSKPRVIRPRPVRP